MQEGNFIVFFSTKLVSLDTGINTSLVLGDYPGNPMVPPSALLILSLKGAVMLIHD